MLLFNFKLQIVSHTIITGAKWKCSICNHRKADICFEMHFPERMILHFDQISAMIVPRGPIDNNSKSMKVAVVPNRKSHYWRIHTVYPKKYAHGFCLAVLCCGYTLTDLPISIRLTSLALWQSDDCPSASKATLMNMDKYFIWIHYERLHNHNKAKHNKTMCIFLGIYCTCTGFSVI